MIYCSFTFIEIIATKQQLLERLIQRIFKRKFKNYEKKTTVFPSTNIVTHPLYVTYCIVSKSIHFTIKFTFDSSTLISIKL